MNQLKPLQESWQFNNSPASIFFHSMPFEPRINFVNLLRGPPLLALFLHCSFSWAFRWVQSQAPWQHLSHLRCSVGHVWYSLHIRMLHKLLMFFFCDPFVKRSVRCGPMVLDMKAWAEHMLDISRYGVLFDAYFVDFVDSPWSLQEMCRHVEPCCTFVSHLTTSQLVGKLGKLCRFLGSFIFFWFLPFLPFCLERSVGEWQSSWLWSFRTHRWRHLRRKLVKRQSSRQRLGRDKLTQSKNNVMERHNVVTCQRMKLGKTTR